MKMYKNNSNASFEFEALAILYPLSHLLISSPLHIYNIIVYKLMMLFLEP